MIKTKRNWLMLLALAGSLSLPGLALADNWQAPQKFAGQHYSRHLARENHREYREHHRDRHEWREHHQYRRYDRDAYRWRARPYYRPHYYPRPVYPRAYWNGYYTAPSAGFWIHVH